MKNLLLFCILCFALPLTVLNAQTHVWTGNGVDGDWFDTANWDVNSVPDATSDVVITSDFVVSLTTNSGVSNSVIVEANGMLIIENDYAVSNEINVDADGAFVFKAGILSGGANITNNGTFKVNSPGDKTFSNITLNNNSLILVAESNQTQFENTTLNISPTGTLDIASNGGFTQQNNNTTLNNSGLVRKREDGINPLGTFYLILDINNEGIMEVGQDQTILILGSDVDLNNMESGIIRGGGVLDITANFVNAGETFPGAENELGSLDITNNFSLNGGTLVLDIFDTSTNGYDTIDIFGSPVMDGLIEVNMMAPLALDDAFDVVTWNLGGDSCTFPQFVTAQYDGQEYTFEILCESNSVRLVVDSISVLGTEEFNLSTISVAPNPINQQTTFQFPAEIITENTKLEVYNYLGQKVRTLGQLTETTSFERKGLPSGIYFAQVLDGKQIVGTTKLVLE